MKTTLLFAFVIGFFAGLRSLTPPAMVAWAAYLEWLKLVRPLSFIGSLPSVVVLSVLAVGEIIFDKLPTTPSRTSAPGLIGRIVTGGLVGACISVSRGHGAIAGAGVGMVGGIAGCFAGYHARARIVRSLRVPDIYVAMFEDLLTISGSLFIVSQL
jgi:uncharacterized membrane protein